MKTSVSIIVPVYNRGALIRYTLESIRRASGDLSIETVIVDDGSNPPATEAIEQLGFPAGKIVRQENQGLLFARLAGLRAATGKYILFLDSDDLISPEKLSRQVAAMEAQGADLSYTDTARCVLEGGYDALEITADDPLPKTTDFVEMLISLQPAPHSPVFTAKYLRLIVDRAFIPPHPLYNPVAEIWFYHNASIFEAEVVKVPGAHSIIGTHPDGRLTDHWEKLGAASLAVMEAFVRHCPAGHRRARQLVAEKAFRSWRRLPRGFSPEFQRRQLAVWHDLQPERRLDQLGGGGFQKLARFFGPVGAATLLQYGQNGSYEGCRTMSDEEVADLLAALPAE